jgi:hypothetical protein
MSLCPVSHCVGVAIEHRCAGSRVRQGRHWMTRTPDDRLKVNWFDELLCVGMSQDSKRNKPR